jgi:hypothetical protein
MTKRNIVIKRKGGGSTTTEAVPEWMRPYIENVMQETEGAYSSGQLDNVAGTNPLLDAAYGSGARQLAGVTGQGLEDLEGQRGRLTGAAQTGGYDTTAIKDAAILEAGVKTAEMGKQYGASGTLGSARQAVQQGAQNAATSAAFAEADRSAAQTNFQNKMGAEQAVGANINASQNLTSGALQGFQALGDSARGIEQQQADAPWQSLQRYASTVFANPNRQSTTAAGGK